MVAYSIKMAKSLHVLTRNVTTRDWCTRVSGSTACLFTSATQQYVRLQQAPASSSIHIVVVSIIRKSLGHSRVWMIWNDWCRANFQRLRSRAVSCCSCLWRPGAFTSTLRRAITLLNLLSRLFPWSARESRHLAPHLVPQLRCFRRPWQEEGYSQSLFPFFECSSSTGEGLFHYL